MLYEVITLSVLGDQGVYPFSVITLMPCEIGFIRKETILQIFKQNEQANEALLSWLAADYRFMYRKLSDMNTLNSHGKLASTLLYLTSPSFRNETLPYLSRNNFV